MGTPAAYLWSALLLLAMVVSDILDGMLARRLNAVSPLGIFLDTISDKIFVTGVLIPMVEQALLASWIAFLIIGREFLVSGLRSYAASQGTVISAGRLGKQKLALTVIALVWRLIAASIEGNTAYPPEHAFAIFMSLWPIFMALAVLWTVLSGADYLWKAWPMLRSAWNPAPATRTAGQASQPAKQTRS